MKVTLNGGEETALEVSLDVTKLNQRVRKLVVKGDSLLTLDKDGHRLGSNTLLGIMGEGVINVGDARLSMPGQPMAFTANCSLASKQDVTLDGEKFEYLLTKLREDVQRAERTPSAVPSQKPVLSYMMIHELLLNAKVRDKE